MTEIEDAEAAVAAEAAEVVAVTMRDVAPGTENALADFRRLVVDPNFFIYLPPFFCLFVKTFPKLKLTNAMVPEFETVTALNNFFSFVFLKVMYTLIKFNIFTWLVERLCLFYGNHPPIQMQ